nr:RNA cytidine acetyltransferase 1 isoform X1 [Tanacetum cinerariifolium]
MGAGLCWGEWGRVVGSSGSGGVEQNHKKKRVKQVKKLMHRGLLDREKVDPFSLLFETAGITHKKKRVKQVKKLMHRGLLDLEKVDPFSLLFETAGITYCQYNDSKRILGNTRCQDIILLRNAYYGIVARTMGATSMCNWKFNIVQDINKVLVTKPHYKTPYELLLGKTPSIGFIRHFGCLVTILNTLDPLGKFDGKADEGFFIAYFNKPNVEGSGLIWLFDIDTLTKSMNYQPVTAENQSNPSAGIQEQFDAEKAGEENVQQYVLFPLWSS